MKKQLREQVRLKYNNKCAYTGTELESDWQVDYIIPKARFYNLSVTGDMNHINNLLPCNRIINHYKRDLDLDGFRRYMTNFHIRLSKLPKKTTVDRTKNRILYMNKVAEYFGITTDKPFNGKFYFETI